MNVAFRMCLDVDEQWVGTAYRMIQIVVKFAIIQQEAEGIIPTI